LGHYIWRQALALGIRLRGQKKMMSCGRYPAVSLALAKSRHNEGRTLLATGMDPMAERKVAKTGERVVTENSFAVDLLI